MTPLVIAWATLLFAGAWSVRPAPGRAGRSAGGIGRAGGAGRVGAVGRAGGAGRVGSIGSIGSIGGAGRAPRAGGIGRVGRAPRVDPARAVPAVAAGAAIVLPVPLVVLAGFAAWALPVLRARRAARHRADAVIRSLPEVVDLIHLAVASGLTVPLAVDAVVRRGRGPIVDDLAAALDDVAFGRRLADALEEVPERAGEAVRPLVAALVASDRYGAPLTDALSRLAGEVRADRRRRAEEAARKVPVKLLFPLVSCVLPAFGLLTLAPLIAGAVAALRL